MQIKNNYRFPYIVLLFFAFSLYCATEAKCKRIDLRIKYKKTAQDTIAAKTVISEIRKATEGDYLVCDSVVIKGTFNLFMAGIRKVKCGLFFDASTFLDTADFRKIIFNNRVSFKDATFNKNGYFNESVFEDLSLFYNANFFSDAIFSFDPISIFDQFSGKTGKGPRFKDAVMFNNSTFSGKALFHYAVFDKYTSFDNVTFENTVEFFEGTNYDNITFVKTTFKGETSIKNWVFNGYTIFQEDSIYKQFVLRYVDFKERSSFSNSVFLGESTFDTITFTGGAVFNSTYFVAKPDFARSQFLSIADFNGIKFLGGIDFRGIDFYRTTQFNNTHFFKNTFFGAVFFHDLTKFNGSWFHQSVTFSDCSFEKSVEFKNTVFIDNIFADNLNFSRMLIKWSQVENKLFPKKNSEETPFVDYSKIYTTFKNNFKNIGQYDDEDACYYNLKKIELHQSWNDLYHGKLASFLNVLVLSFLWCTCGFGVMPFLTLLISIGIIFLCSLVYKYGFKLKGEEKFLTSEHDDIHNPFLTNIKDFFDVFLFSLNTFFTVGYGHWYSKTYSVRHLTVKTNSLLFRFFVIVEGSIGIILITIFIVSLSVKYIRL
jgi:Ion channel